MSYCSAHNTEVTFKEEEVNKGAQTFGTYLEIANLFKMIMQDKLMGKTPGKVITHKADEEEEKWESRLCKNPYFSLR